MTDATTNNYSSGHPWYYKLGGTILKPSQIIEHVKAAGQQITSRSRSDRKPYAKLNKKLFLIIAAICPVIVSLPVSFAQSDSRTAQFTKAQDALIFIRASVLSIIIFTMILHI